MFSLFRLQTPDRVLLLLLLLVAMRMGLFVLGPPYVLPEVNWMLVGEKLLDGHLLYQDVWEDIGPIPALVYTGLAAIAPRSALLSVVAATVLTFVQALLFNRACARNEVFDEKTLMPGAMFVLFSNLAPDFCYLNPAQIGLTFLIPVLGHIFRHIRTGLEEHQIYETGFWVGMAALCYMPYTLMVLVPAASFILYTGTRPRWYAVLFIGMLFPAIVAGFVFYFLGVLNGFANHYLLTAFSVPKHAYISFGFLFPLLIPGLALAVWAAVRTISHRGFINYQQVSHVVLLMWAIVGALTWFFASWHQPALLWVLVLPAAYYTAHWCSLVRKAVLRELLLVAMLGYSLVCIYLPFLPLPYLRGQLLAQGLLHFEPRYPTIAAKRVLVMGTAPQFYLANELATPYLNRRLAARIIDDSLDLKSNYELYASFRQSMPEVILDADSTLPGLFRRMPLLASFYDRDESLRGIYFLKRKRVQEVVK